MVSRETSDVLEQYWTILRRWNAGANLISKGSVSNGFHRHVCDAVQIAPLISNTPLVLVDLGSGGGLPAIPLAIVRRSAGIADRHRLVEADRRKASFLHYASAELKLDLEIATQRAETMNGLKADVLTSRAMAPLVAMMPHLHRHLDRHGVAILHKGRNVGYEIEAARRDWAFHLDTLPSTTAEDAVILRIASVRPR